MEEGKSEANSGDSNVETRRDGIAIGDRWKRVVKNVEEAEMMWSI